MTIKTTPRPRVAFPLAAACALALGLAGCANKPKPPGPDDKSEVKVEIGEIRMPSGVDLSRMRPLNDGRTTKVFLEQLRVDAAAQSKLLFPPQMAQQMNMTPLQLTRIFTDTILQGRRFEVFDIAASVTAGNADYVIDALITGAEQELRPIEGGLRVVVTRVNLSVQMKNVYTGTFVFPAAVAVEGVTGLTSGDRCVVQARQTPSTLEVQQCMANDYVRALRRAYAAATTRIEAVVRPLGKVLSVDRNSVGLFGGQKHGLLSGDRLVVFRATTARLGEREVIASTRALAVVRCDGPGTDSSQCDVVRIAPGAKIEAGDFAVLTDDSLKKDRAL